MNVVPQSLNKGFPPHGNAQALRDVYPVARCLPTLFPSMAALSAQMTHLHGHVARSTLHMNFGGKTATQIRRRLVDLAALSLSAARSLGSFDLDHAVGEMLAEMARQDDKWGANRDHPVAIWALILSEEVGEFADACLKMADRDASVEAIQVAAVALQAIEYIDRRDVMARAALRVLETEKG